MNISIHLFKLQSSVEKAARNFYKLIVEFMASFWVQVFIEKKMLECEQSWEQCRKLDQLLLAMIDEHEGGGESEKKEEDTQYEYELKMEELREASTIYLERRRTEPPSVAGSATGSLIDPDENIEGRDRIPEEENRREIDPLHTHLESGNRT